MTNDDEQQKAVTALFDRIAPTYDFLNTLLSLGVDRRWRRKLIQWIPDPHQDGDQGGTQGETKVRRQLLDVATGSGDVVLMAARKLRSYQKFLAVDVSENMLSVALRKKARLQLAVDVDFVLADGRAIPVKEASFDTITISFGLRNIPSASDALQEFYRVLRPGGSLLVLEFFPARGGLALRIFELYFRVVLPMIAGFFTRKSDYRYLPQSVKKFQSVSELDQLARRAGFIPQGKHRFMLGICYLMRWKKSPKSGRPLHRESDL